MDDTSRFLVVARRAGRQRLWRRATADAALLLAGLGLAGVLGTWLTGRGDLFGPAAALLGAAAVGARAGWSRARDRALFGAGAGAVLQTARTIARAGPSDPARVGNLDAVMRREVLACAELQAGVGARGCSEELRRAYVNDVGARLRATGADPRQILVGASLRARLGTAALLIGLWALTTWSPPLLHALAGTWSGSDLRPPPDERSALAEVTLRLEYPDHTGRAPAEVRNPTGRLRAPAGTRVTLRLGPSAPAQAVRVRWLEEVDEATAAPPPQLVPCQRDDTGAFQCTFQVRASGRWTALLFDDIDAETTRRRGPPGEILLEQDRVPEVELTPPAVREARADMDTIALRIRLRDDFGVVRADLVAQIGDEREQRVPLALPDGDAKDLRFVHDWDLSTLPVEERARVSYWVEARDADPGLGLVPLEDPPGKVGRSSVLQLDVRDEEQEHASNIERLVEVRDGAVDLLAARLATAEAESETGAAAHLQRARTIHVQTEAVLAQLVGLVDAFAVDPQSGPLDAEELQGIHRRLAAMHRSEGELHARMPPGAELLNPRAVEAHLARLAPRLRAGVAVCEDETIRIDDLLVTQVLRRLDLLLGRLRALQQRIVAAIEQQRPDVDDLRRRRVDALRRINELRALLRQELEDEWLNRDAFAVLERLGQPDEGDHGLDQEREALEQLERMSGELEDRLAGEAGAAAGLSEEERARIGLMRALSRLQAEQESLRDDTMAAHEDWRKAVTSAPGASETTLRSAARGTLDRMARVNDARLGRDARAALRDARLRLKLLERGAGAGGAASGLERWEALAEAEDALDRALAGAPAGESEARALEGIRADVSRWRREAADALPSPLQALGPDARTRAHGLDDTQRRLRTSLDTLLEGASADPLPEEGRAAAREALRAMEAGSTRLRAVRPGDALTPQLDAGAALQRAIDSLRRGGSPPPARSVGEASTEASQDRSLRDELRESMREDAPPSYAEPIRRYFEELLR